MNADHALDSWGPGDARAALSERAQRVEVTARVVAITDVSIIIRRARPGSASPLGRPAKPAGLVCDHFGGQKGVVGHQRSKFRTLCSSVP